MKMRLLMKGVVLSTLVVLLASVSFAKIPAKKKAKKKADDAVATTAPDAEAAPAVPAQTAATKKKDDYKPAPTFTPVLATTGTIGAFTVETGDTLPAHGIAVSAYGNKFSRMPGSVTILQMGIDANYGVTDRLSLYVLFDPYSYAHVGCGPQLSLAPPNSAAPFYGNTMIHTLSSGTLCNSVTPSTAFNAGTPGFVADYPFVSGDSGGPGNVTFGAKYAFLSQRAGDAVSFSVRNDFSFSPRQSLSYELSNGTLPSPFSDLISGAVSRQWGNTVTASFNLGFQFNRNPHNGGGVPVVQMKDQVRSGVGFILFPESRFQPMTEYTAVAFCCKKQALNYDTVFGTNTPVDGVWGIRMYPTKNIAFDAGYRYMLNLRGANDRHGFVFKLGYTYWPEKAPPVNHPPTISCTEDKDMVYLDSGDVVSVNCPASDPDNDPLTYTWSSTCGKVDGTGAQVRWLSAGVPVGSCAITAKVDDGRGGSASSGVSVRVEPKPNHPPTITCMADRSSVFTGERVHITTNASDPDGDQLTYTWRANAGQVVGTGAAVDFDTSGLAPGNYNITVRVDDGRGGAADCSSTVEVKPVPPPPQASKINECAFGKPLSTRIDNVCKRVLDDVALRLQSEPRATAVIIGYSDPKEKKPATVAGDRGTNAVKYLGEKGIDASRVSTRTGTGQAGATNNRRIDIVFVPEGATY